MRLDFVFAPMLEPWPYGNEHQYSGGQSHNLYPVHASIPINYVATKNPTLGRVFVRLYARLLVIAACEAQDLQKADEDVEEAQVQTVGGHYVVRLAAAHNRTGLHEDKRAHEQDDACRQAQR